MYSQLHQIITKCLSISRYCSITPITKYLVFLMKKMMLLLNFRSDDKLNDWL